MTGYALVQTWAHAVAARAFRKAARLWRSTPEPLAMALAHRLDHEVHDDAERLAVEHLEPGLYRVGSRPGLVVGVRSQTLVSPQTALRARLTAHWARSTVASMTQVAPDGQVFASSATKRAAAAAARIARALGFDTPPAVTMFVPDRPALRQLLAIERRFGSFTHEWAWTDPFGGDVVARDLLDIHEIVHAITNHLPGWPPALVREGLAECFTHPFDWQYWLRLPVPPTAASMWPILPGHKPGWYSTAMLTVLALRQATGPDGFLALWGSVPAEASLATTAAAAGLSSDALEDRVRRLGTALKTGRCTLSMAHGASALFAASPQGHDAYTHPAVTGVQSMVTNLT